MEKQEMVGGGLQHDKSCQEHMWMTGASDRSPLPCHSAALNERIWEPTRGGDRRPVSWVAVNQKLRHAMPLSNRAHISTTRQLLNGGSELRVIITKVTETEWA